MSSRSIEGANPLYLPQAKIYAGSCALGPAITPVWELPDPSDLAITVRVRRDEETVWSGQTRTAMMRRTFPDLVEHLFRSDWFPHGAVLATGTGIVPDLDFTLHNGDTVTITIEGIGELTNQVVTGREPFAWLSDAVWDETPRRGI